MQKYWKCGGGLVVCAMLLAGCSSPKASVFRVQQGIQSQFKAPSAAEADAEVLRASKEYCRKRGAEVVVLSKDDTRYEGGLNETVNKVVKATGKFVPGVGFFADDTPYTANLTFRCEESALVKSGADDD